MIPLDVKLTKIKEIKLKIETRISKMNSSPDWATVKRLVKIIEKEEKMNKNIKTLSKKIITFQRRLQPLEKKAAKMGVNIPMPK